MWRGTWAAILNTGVRIGLTGKVGFKQRFEEKNKVGREEEVEEKEKEIDRGRWRRRKKEMEKEKEEKEGKFQAEIVNVITLRSGC